MPILTVFCFVITFIIISYILYHLEGLQDLIITRENKTKVQLTVFNIM